MDRLDALKDPTWRLFVRIADEPHRKGILLRLERPGYPDVEVRERTVRAARDKLSSLIESEGKEIRDRTSPEAKVQASAAVTRQRGSSPRAVADARWRAGPSVSKNRFEPRVAAAIDRVAARIKAEDVAARSVKKAGNRQAEVSRVKPAGSKQAGKPRNVAARRDGEGHLPGAPQGYPTTSRLTDARWQVSGSPGTRKRQ